MKIIWFAISVTARQASHMASSPLKDQHLVIQTKGTRLSFKQKGAAGGSGEQSVTCGFECSTSDSAI